MSVFWHEHHDWEDYGRVELPIEADLNAWVKYVDEGMDFLSNDLSFLYATPEEVDIGEEVLDGEYLPDRLGHTQGQSS